MFAAEAAVKPTLSDALSGWDGPYFLATIIVLIVAGTLSTTSTTTM